LNSFSIDVIRITLSIIGNVYNLIDRNITIGTK